MIDLWIEMAARDSGRVKPFTGHLVRGALLNLIEKTDPELSRILHEPHQTRPYSITPATPVAHQKTIRENLWWIKPQEHVEFHIGLLQEQTEEKILQGILENMQEIKLGETPFTPTKINFKKTTHQELVKSAKPQRTITINFQTPTRLSIRGRDFPLLFPDPRHIYGSLAHLWNTYAPPQLQVDTEELHQWVEKNVYIHEYQLQTQEVDLGEEGKQVGFTGTLKYGIKSTKKYAPWINILTRYATTSNIGTKRTAGMGAIQKIEQNKTPTKK